MVQVNLQTFSVEFFENYMNFLINQLYKNLCLKEEKNDTLKSHLESMQREIIGNKELVTFLKNDARVMSILSRLQYLSTHETEHKVFRKEILHCIDLVKKMKNQYIESVVRNP